MSMYTENKSWLKSTTIHGIIIASVPAIATMATLAFGGEMLGEQELREGIEAVVTIAALGMAAYGRFRAIKRIE